MCLTKQELLARARMSKQEVVGAETMPRSMRMPRASWPHRAQPDCSGTQTKSSCAKSRLWHLNTTRIEPQSEEVERKNGASVPFSFRSSAQRSQSGVRIGAAKDTPRWASATWLLSLRRQGGRDDVRVPASRQRRRRAGHGHGWLDAADFGSGTITQGLCNLEIHIL